MKEKQIQISVSLFTMLVMHYVFAQEVDEEKIKSELEKKLKAVEKRMNYTESKTAPTEELREMARQQYLEAVGMHQDFQW